MANCLSNSFSLSVSIPVLTPVLTIAASARSLGERFRALRAAASVMRDEMGMMLKRATEEPMSRARGAVRRVRS